MIGLILSGGENRRIPVPKGFLTVGGKAIIERSIDILGSIFGRVVISTNTPERYFLLGVPLIGDIMSEKGPMAGILSVFAVTGEDSVFVVACDMPFINEDLIRYMAEIYKGVEGGQVDAVIPVFEGKKEPLFGIYTKRIMETMEKMIQGGQMSLSEMLTDLRVHYITEDEIRDIDPLCESFVNINSMEDYERIGGKECLV